MREYIDKSELMSVCLKSVLSKVPTHSFSICENFVFTRPVELADALGMSTSFVCEEVKKGALQHLNSGIDALIEIGGVKDYLWNKFFPSISLYEDMLYLTVSSRRANYLTRFFNRQEERYFPHLLSVDTCSDFMMVSKSEIYQLLHYHALPYFRFGNRYRIPKLFVSEIVSAIGREEFTRLEALYKRELI